MCTLTTEQLAVDGHGKGPEGWLRLESATVCYDHPTRGTADHVLVIDLWGGDVRSGSRVAIELSATSATALERAIHQALASPQARQDLSGGVATA
jgi:hypothetical protein